MNHSFSREEKENILKALDQVEGIMRTLLGGLKEKWVTPKQAGARLGVSETTIKRMCDKGKLEFTTTVGGHRRILASQLDTQPAIAVRQLLT